MRHETVETDYVFELDLKELHVSEGIDLGFKGRELKNVGTQFTKKLFLVCETTRVAANIHDFTGKIHIILTHPCVPTVVHIT